jgi:hypothetical protein
MNNFTPKVGEDCLVEGTYSEFKIIAGPDSDGCYCLAIKDNGGYLLKHKLCIKPLKTPAEIEREKDVMELTNIVNEWLDESNSVATLVNWILDSNWVDGKFKQQVKPLSKKHAIGGIGITSSTYLRLVEQGFIVQGEG